MSVILESLTRSEVLQSISRALEVSGDDAGNGHAGEDRLISSGISWERYLEVDEALGQDRPDPRLYYLNGELEIVTTSLLHEKLKKWLGDLIGDFFLRRASMFLPMARPRSEFFGKPEPNRMSRGA